jgi:hypothetical protein
MRLALACGCLALASTVAAKDLIVRERSSMFSGQLPDEHTVYIAGSTIVTDSRTTRTIVDLERKTITTVEPATRSYTVITFDDLRAQMDALRQALETTRPDARVTLSGLFDDGGPVTLESTGRTDTIATYPAREYSLRGGPYSGFVWATEAIEKPAAFEKWKDLDRSRGGAARRLAEAMVKVDGFPLRARIEASGGEQAIVITNEAFEVREGSPPRALLDVPPGFTPSASAAPSRATP